MNLFVILGSVLFVLLGVFVITDPVYYNTIYTYTFDFTHRRWVIGPLSIFVGLALLWTELRKYAKERPSSKEDPDESP
jgi:hypothetical protein